MNSSCSRKALSRLSAKTVAFWVCWFSITAFPAFSWSGNLSGRVEVHFINVGQADAILMMSAGKECVLLIDSGDTRYPESSKNFRRYLAERLSKGREIHLVVASHPHADHVGSMRWVLQNYRVRTLIDNGRAYESTLYRNLKEEIGKQVNERGLRYFRQSDVPAMEQDFCPADNLDSVILYPQGGYSQEACKRNQNNCSVVLKVTYGATTFLFPGDAEAEQEDVLLKDATIRRQLSAQVLKAPHHGSDTSSSKEFLRAVSPSWIVVSAGKKEVGTNVRYKHPRLSTITNFLEFLGVHDAEKRMTDVYDAKKKRWVRRAISGSLYVTARDGSVVLTSDGVAVRKE